MKRIYKNIRIYIAIAMITTVILLLYSFGLNRPHSFSCQANLVQHHQDDTINVWMKYHFDQEGGVLSINGKSSADPEKKFNRLIAFEHKKKGGFYYLTSKEIFKFPEDNVTDDWIKRYEALFFIYPNKSIYLQINKQSNGFYLFSLGTLPVYLCKNSE